MKCTKKQYGKTKDPGLQKINLNIKQTNKQKTPRGIIITDFKLPYRDVVMKISRSWHKKQMY